MSGGRTSWRHRCHGLHDRPEAPVEPGSECSSPCNTTRAKGLGVAVHVAMASVIHRPRGSAPAPARRRARRAIARRRRRATLDARQPRRTIGLKFPLTRSGCRRVAFFVHTTVVAARARIVAVHRALTSENSVSRREDRHAGRRDTRKVAGISTDRPRVIRRELRSLYTFPNERAHLGRRELRPFILPFCHSGSNLLVT